MDNETHNTASPESRDVASSKGPRVLPCITFFVMVIASMFAAAVVSEAPLIVVGLY